MATAWRSRWLDWQPGDEIISVSPKTDLTKLTKNDSGSFVSGVSRETHIISPATSSGMAAHDPLEWTAEFEAWAPQECVFRDRCFGGIGCLHVDFAEWCTAHDSVPCTRAVFELLLNDQGFLVADGFVYGLVLKADLLAHERFAAKATNAAPVQHVIAAPVRKGRQPAGRTA